MNAVLDRLLAQRDEQTSFIDTLLGRVAEEERDLVDAEKSNLEAARQRITELDAQIKPLDEFESVRETHRAAAPKAPARAEREARRPLSVESRAYEYQTSGEFIVDLIKARGYPGQNVDPDDEAKARVASALGRAVDKLTTTEIPGVLPKPIVGAVMTDIDAARPLIASLGARALAGIPGKSFLRPHVTQHTLVGPQSAEKAELPSRTLKIDSIEFAKNTYGGVVNVSRQAIDWSSPSAWDALVADLQASYAAETDDVTADDFAAKVTQTVEADTSDVQSIIAGLYEAAALAATGGTNGRASALRLPNHIWVSVDQWAKIGAAVDSLRATSSSSISSGTGTPTSFAGDILGVPRTLVPGFPEGTVVVGRTDKYEFYEERIGLLSAVEPRILGVEVAYGGYAAFGMLDATCFAKVVAPAVGGASATASKTTTTK